MQDPRIEALARTLVHHSVALQSGERVLIVGPEESRPLALAVYREAVRVGALPILWATFEDSARILLDLGSDEQIGWPNPILIEATRQVDAYISLRAPSNLRLLAGVDPAKSVMAQKARRHFLDVALQKKWVVCELPTPALAQEAGMSTEEFEAFSFAAVSADWPAMRADLDRLKAILERGSRVRIQAPGTDLTLGVGGRTWIADSGAHNMPGGEIFTGPRESEVDGHISFGYPAVLNGRIAEGVRLTFVDGRVTDASAERGEEFLIAMLDTDAGARVVGELGIGTNYGITRHTRSTLFDEKIGGTIHIALGRSYPETGGVNDSALHWDMVCDLRQGGSIDLDGVGIQRAGRFTV